MQHHNRHHPEDHRRLVIFFIMAAIIMALSYFFITKPQMDKARQQQGMVTQAKQNTVAPPVAEAQTLRDVSAVLAGSDQSKRVALDSKRLQGSVPLKGLRFDDLQLKSYYTTLQKEEMVRLLSPSDTKQTYFVEIGLMPEDKNIAVPTQDTVWKLVAGDKLTPENQVVMEWNNGQGLTFRRIVSMDQRYVMTVVQDIANSTDKNVTLYPYALVSQTHHIPQKGEKVSFEDQPSSVQHIGPIGFLNDKLQEKSYKDVLEEQFKFDHTKGWAGISSKYWLVSLLPQNDQLFDARFSHETGALKQDIYQVDMRGQALVVPANGAAKTDMRFFAGAKKLSIMQDYEDELKIDRFDLAVDFGRLYILTKPLYYLLSSMGEYIHKEFGTAKSFGIALLLMTVLLRALTFPLQNKAYKSMNRMKDMAPKINALKEKHRDDKPKFQQEMLEFYKKEKINPASGCLPILLQIPIFFALYKVIYITLDMRHAPFWGWIHDLSAPDPTNVFNLFGLLPYQLPVFLTIGAWPILYGLTMWAQQRLNPKPEDPTQQQIFALMPWMFMFIFAKFPAGLVIYYTWSNLLGVIQQYALRRFNPGTTPQEKSGMNEITQKHMEEGKALFKHPAQFIWGSQTPGSWPTTWFPEIAFVGRSNVGKSSLLNALTGIKGLAKVSRTPGRTQQFNFFNLGDRMVLLDMPGYGYAKVGKKLEQMWAEMADNYFKTRDQLKRMFVLVDSRHGLKENDLMLMDWLNRLAVPYQIILTKVDKASATELKAVQDAVTQTLQKHAAALPDVLLTSSEKKQGIEQLRGVIASLRKG